MCASSQPCHFLTLLPAFHQLSLLPSLLPAQTQKGFSIAHLGDGKSPVSDYNALLPAFEEVKEHNLLYDMKDVKLLSVGQGGGQNRFAMCEGFCEEGVCLALFPRALVAV